MAAAAFFYAGSLAIPWQLLIVVIFLFFGTLAFFAVLFDEKPSEGNEPLIVPSEFGEENERDIHRLNSSDA